MRKIAFCVSLLAVLPAVHANASEPSFVDVEGGRLSYESCSPKNYTRTIVLVHDGIVDSAVWNGVWPILCKKFRTVRFDERGYGNSPQSTLPYSSVDDISKLMNALRIERAILVASSANGGRAMALALNHPEAVDVLVVSGPSVPGVPYSDDFIKLLTPLGESVVKGDIQGAMAAVEQCPFCVAPKNAKARQQLMALLHDHPQDLQTRPLEKSGESIADRLSDLKMPTLIIVGDADHPNNLNHARIAHEMIHQSSLGHHQRCRAFAISGTSEGIRTPRHRFHRSALILFPRLAGEPGHENAKRS